MLTLTVIFALIAYFLFDHNYPICVTAKRSAEMHHEPYITHGPERVTRWLITCDHATNLIPDHINGGCLGLSPEDMERHIAYDVGAAGVSRHLADILHGTAVMANFSRLVIDPNRGEGDPTLLMRLYDGSVVPGNRNACENEKQRRLATLHRPYHNAVASFAERRKDTVIIAIHSFTPKLQGRPHRPWQVAVLHSKDRRFSDPLVKRLMLEPDLVVGDDQPYFGYLPDDSIDRHGRAQNRPHALIEIRNDLIMDDQGQAEWAERLAPILEEVLLQTGL